MESTHQRFPLPVAHRRSLHESCYFTHLHKSLRFHLASPLDLDQLYTYLSTVHKLLKYEDLKKIKNALSQGWLILSSDFFEVCGMLAGRVVVGDTSGKTLHIEWTGVYDVYEKDNLLERQLLTEAFKYAFQQEIVQIFYKPQNEQLRKVAENLGMKQTNESLMFVEMNKLGAVLTEEPRMPDAYLLDQSYKRRCLKRFTPKRLGRELKVEVILPEDEQVFRHYMFNEFMNQTPVNKTLQLSEAESYEQFVGRWDGDQFKQGLCLAVTDKGRICAGGACKPIHVTNEERLNWQPIEVPVDLKGEADRINYSTQRSREAQAINIWMGGFVAQFLPPGCFDYMRVEMRSVHPYYARCGIANAITEATNQIILENGCNVFQTLYLAHAMTRKVEGKQAYPPVAVRFPYSQFKYNGRQIIPNGMTSDGGEFVTVNVGFVQQPKEESERLLAKL